MSAPKSLLSNKDRQGHPRQQIAKLVRIARRAQCKADWLATLLGLPEGDRSDPSFGFYARVTRNAGEAHRLDWERDRRTTEADRAEAQAKAERAAAEIADIAATHRVRP